MGFLFVVINRSFHVSLQFPMNQNNPAVLGGGVIVFVRGNRLLFFLIVRLGRFILQILADLVAQGFGFGRARSALTFLR
jgi:hypothetical protein